MSEKQKGVATILILAICMICMIFITKNINTNQKTKQVDSVQVDTFIADSTENVINDSVISNN